MMTINIWGVLSLGVIFATMALQFVNFKVFHKDGRNSTRITLIVKEVFFAVHAIMLVKVNSAVMEAFSLWFSTIFGIFYFFGLCCWFFVFLRGLYPRENG